MNAKAKMAQKPKHDIVALYSKVRACEGRIPGEMLTLKPGEPRTIWPGPSNKRKQPPSCLTAVLQEASTDQPTLLKVVAKIQDILTGLYCGMFTCEYDSDLDIVHLKKRGARVSTYRKRGTTF